MRAPRLLDKPVDKPIDVKSMGTGYNKLGAVYEKMGEINKAIVCMQRSQVLVHTCIACFLLLS